MVGGRQLEFNKQQVLEAAMKVFWQRGYVGASLSELTKNMNINKPSLYSTFGNKEQLFLQATEYYLQEYGLHHQRYLDEATLPLEQRLYHYLHSIISQQCDDRTPKGCYISLCITECVSECVPESIAAMIDKVNNNNEIKLTHVFEQEQSQGKLPKNFQAKNAALFILNTLHGTATLARAGKTLKELEVIIKTTLSILR